ncbi:MAG: alkaline phosphatase family protein [Adhaeribacter sp.]
MKRLILSIIFTGLLALTGYGQQAQHVILISIDGLRPDFYLDKSWPAPNLQRLMAQGAYSRGVNSVFPSVTYPAHTSLITGALPARHGIYYNSPVGGLPGQWYWEASYIQTPTLFDAVRQAGKKSGSVQWPVTVGAPIDYNFPVRRAQGKEKDDPLGLIRPLVRPAGLLEEVEKASGHRISEADFDHHLIDRNIGRVANHILATHKPEFLAIHFVSVDHVGHEQGREGKKLRKSLAQVDSLVGSVLATVERAGLKGKTAVVVTGDHGMVDVNTHLAPNVWLSQQGLLGKNDKDSWKARFVPAGGAAFLYLKDKKDKATLRQVEALLSKLPQDQMRFRVLSRSQLDAAGANPEPVLALAFDKGVAYNGAVEGAALRPAKKGGAHGYYPDFADIQTGFLAVGPGLKPGLDVGQMGIQDVAPFIAHLLGLNFRAPDGRLLPALTNTKTSKK